jgi:hypothetical protein
MKRGTKNCTWASCREGCTRELYNCTQIRVDYRIAPLGLPLTPLQLEGGTDIGTEMTSPMPSDAAPSAELNEWSVQVANKMASRPSPDYESSPIEWTSDWIDRTSPHKLNKREVTIVPLMNDTSVWFYNGAKLFPNVKGWVHNCFFFILL